MGFLSYLWNPSLNLKREVVNSWSEMNVYCFKNSKNEYRDFKFAKTQTNNQKKRSKLIYFNESGEIKTEIKFEYPDNSTEVTVFLNGQNSNRDYKLFNESGLLSEEREKSLFGGVDITKYIYDGKDRLIKVIQEEDGEITTETLEHNDVGVQKIITKDQDGDSLLRGFIYNDQGKLERMVRVQEDIVNLEEKYFYNKEGQIIQIITESTNRLKGGKNSLSIKKFEYHSNGKVKLEVFQTIETYENEVKSESKESYNENGLMLESQEVDFKRGLTEIFKYEYKF